MRIAALYDVHGNLPALEAVLRDPRCASAELIVSGGDLVAGPMPRACLERLLALGERVLFVRGNADREVAEKDDLPSRWCREQLGTALLDVVRRWPLAVEAELDVGRTSFAHATTRSDEEIVTRVTPDGDVLAAFADSAPTAVVGHTHVQFDRQVGDLRLVNAGSVGMPFEGRTAAFWALADSEVRLLATDYSASEAAALIRATGSPFAADAADGLLSPSTADEATAIFECRRRGA